MEGSEPHAWSNLRLDLVYTDWHLNFLGMDRKTLPPWVVPVERVLPIMVGQEETLHTFYVLKDLAEEKGFVLRHLAGLATMRLLLKAETSSWKVDRNPVHSGPTPDAIWLRGERIAIEYDAGYPKETVLGKMYGMSYRFPLQIWGAPTRVRVLYLENLIPKTLKGKIRVLYAPWT